MRLYIFDEYNRSGYWWGRKAVPAARCETGSPEYCYALYTGGALIQGLPSGALDQGVYILALSSTVGRHDT